MPQYRITRDEVWTRTYELRAECPADALERAAEDGRVTGKHFSYRDPGMYQCVEELDEEGEVAEVHHLDQIH